MIKTFNKIVLNYLILLIIFLFFLTVSCYIPSTWLKKNIGKTLITLKSEGIYPSFGLPWRKIVLDNFTDSLMINTAYSVDSKTPFKSALINVRYDGKIDSFNQILNLEKLYLKKEINKIYYERYWHGYLIFLRLILIFLSYSGIRFFILLIIYLIFFYFIYLCWRKIGLLSTIAFILGFIFTDFFYIWKSMQFSSVFLIGLIGAIYLLHVYKKNYDLSQIFFIIGGLTSFFDLLTAPLVALSLPLMISIFLQKEDIKKMFNNIFFWIFGYFSLWFSKWIIVESLYFKGAITTSVNKILDRTINSNNVNLIQLIAIKLNFFQLIGYDRKNKFVVLFFVIFYLAFFLRYFNFRYKNLKNIFTWIILGLIPYAWYLIAANHSYFHVWYTYRNQFISVVSFFIITFKFINWISVKKDILFFKRKINNLLIFNSKNSP